MLHIRRKLFGGNNKKQGDGINTEAVDQLMEHIGKAPVQYNNRQGRGVSHLRPRLDDKKLLGWELNIGEHSTFDDKLLAAYRMKESPFREAADIAGHMRYNFWEFWAEIEDARLANRAADWYARPAIQDTLHDIIAKQVGPTAGELRDGALSLSMWAVRRIANGLPVTPPPAIHSDVLEYVWRTVDLIEGQFGDDIRDAVKSNDGDKAMITAAAIASLFSQKQPEMQPKPQGTCGLPCPVGKPTSPKPSSADADKSLKYQEWAEGMRRTAMENGTAELDRARAEVEAAKAEATGTRQGSWWNLGEWGGWAQEDGQGDPLNSVFDGISTTGKNPGTDICHDRHEALMLSDIKEEATVLHSVTNLAIEDTRDGLATVLSELGSVTPRAWRVNYGDMKVFVRPPKQRGRVLVMMDTSGSMGCPCESCRKYRPGNSAYLAWQAAAAIARRLPDTEVFTFADRGGVVKLAQMTPGYQPDHLGNAMLSGGTPICGALLFGEERLRKDLTGSAMVFITDGEPNSVEHTRRLAKAFYLDGMRFAVILVNNPTDSFNVFPNAATFSLDGVDDLSAVGDAIAYLNTLT